MQCAKGAQEPRDCTVGAGKAVDVSTVCFTPLTADCHTTGPQFKDTLAKLHPVPCQKQAVKERNMGLACCSWAICSSRAQSP